MATHLLVWNPNRASWRELPDLVRRFMSGNPVTAYWSCGSNRRLRKNDRIFLIRLNRFPVGIFASGRVLRGSHAAPSRIAQDSGRSGQGLFVEIRFDMLANPDAAMPLTRRELTRGALQRFHWEESTSGRTLPESIAAPLEQAWIEYFGATKSKTHDAPEQTAATQATTTQHPPPARDTITKPPAPPKPPAHTPKDQKFTALFEHYLTMLQAATQGEVLHQAQHINELIHAFPDLDKHDVRDHYRQISSVLRYCGLPFLDIYPPDTAPNHDLRERLGRFFHHYEEHLSAIWFDDDAIRNRTVPDELLDVQGAWAPPPLNLNFKVDGFLGGHARFPALGGFQLRETRRDTLHRAGLRFVLAFERTRLKRLQQNELANNIRAFDADAARRHGYDIVSFEASGRERYIAVSTTQYSRQFPFLVAPRTLVASAKYTKQFFYYRVFSFCVDAKLYMLQGDLRESTDFLQKQQHPLSMRHFN